MYLSLDLVGEGSKGFFDIDCILGRSLQEFDAKRISQSLAFLGFNLSACLQIRFVADQQFYNVLVPVLIDFGQPVLNVLERLPVGDVIDQDDSVSTLVVTGSNSLESLLSGCVPDLELHCGAVRLECSNFEINTNCG